MGKTAIKLRLPDELFPRILQLLYHIKEEISQYQQDNVHVLRSILYETLMLLDRAYKQTMPTKVTSKEMGNLHLTKFIGLVGRYAKEQPSVRFYADLLCITPNYLNEITSYALRISAKQYIQSKRMEEAKRMLAYTEASISEIANELHFSTVSYFTRSFHQYVDISPLAYRQEHKP